jgi:hypothetical protein
LFRDLSAAEAITVLDPAWRWTSEIGGMSSDGETADCLGAELRPKPGMVDIANRAF